MGKDPHNIVPSPDTYNLSSFVEENKAHKKGFSPLYSREVLRTQCRKSLLWVTLISKNRKCLVLEGMNSIASMTPPNGQWDQGSVKNVYLRWFSVSQDYCLDSPCAVHLQQFWRDRQESRGKVPSLQLPQLQSQNFQSSSFEKIQQIQYFNFHAATDVPGPGVYKPQNDLSS